MKFKKISIGLIALWFLFLTAATFWSVKEENKTLPSVWTEEAQEGSIEYEFPVDLEVSAADQAIGYISMYIGFEAEARRMSVSIAVRSSGATKLAT